MPDLNRADPDMPEHPPLITIAMPVYNAGAYLRPAIVSILQQTIADWELLVIDDGSTDGAVDAIGDLRDSRIRILRDGRNRGLAARLNEAIDIARGRFLARMDQDDISYPERLATQLAMLEQNPELDLVVVRCLAIDAEGEAVGTMPVALTHDDVVRETVARILPSPSDVVRQDRMVSAAQVCGSGALLLRGSGTAAAQLPREQVCLDTGNPVCLSRA